MHKKIILFSLLTFCILQSSHTQENTIRNITTGEYEFFLDKQNNNYLTAASLGATLASLACIVKKNKIAWVGWAGAPFFGTIFYIHICMLLQSDYPYIRVTHEGIWSQNWGFVPWRAIEKVKHLKQRIHLYLTQAALPYYQHLSMINTTNTLVIVDNLNVSLKDCYDSIERAHRQSQQK
jgi:hypothetical protein